MEAQHLAWQLYVGFPPVQAKEAILEMDSYCECTLFACFVFDCAHV